MNTKKIAIILCTLFTGLVACEEYEDYLVDYKFSAVYFATQRPLRTIVAYDDMQFKVGVALAGKRENNTEEWASYTIAPELLSDPEVMDGNTFTLLPSEYYTLSNTEQMVVPEGKFIGDVTVTLNREAFTSDPLAHQNTYALPLKLVETSADSILSGTYDQDGNVLTLPKNYTVVVVKYISPLHGVYYHKGVQKEYDGTGTLVSETVYNEADLSQNATWNLTTLGLDTVLTSGAGAGNEALKLTRNADNTVTVEAGNAAITVTEGSGTYDEEKRAFYLDYVFTDGTRTFDVVDTLIIRQAPEEDLRFEEW